MISPSLLMLIAPSAGATAEAQATAAAPTWAMIAAWSAVAVVCALIAGVCAGAEMGLYSVNRVRLKLRARAGDPGAKTLAEELHTPGRLLGALLICYNVFSYLAAIGITRSLGHAGFGELGIVILNTIVITPILFVFVDAVPMEVFRLEPDRPIYWLARPLKWVRVFLTYTGILPMVSALSRGLSSLFHGADEASVQDARSRIIGLLKEGAHHGVISETQVGLLDRALALRTARVGDEMVLWSTAIKLHDSMSRQRVLEIVSAHPFSRFPVIADRPIGAVASAGGGWGQVVGVVETIDLCLNPHTPLVELVKPIARLDASMGVREGLLRLTAEGAAMAIVTTGSREGAAPRGIVTAKDLIEPLTGELKVF